MPPPPTVLARGPWDPTQVEVSWSTEVFEPPQRASEAADAAVDDLRERGSPSHDGFAARLAGFRAEGPRLVLELQPARWSLRLSTEDASHSMSAQCLVRDAGGRWLAGRRAAWLATWASRWALGAAGSVEVGENPVDTLRRELEEEWSVAPERLVIEALVRLPSTLVLLVGQAWLPEGATVTPDEEHDEYAWWPADVERWPVEGDAPLRRMAALLTVSS